VLELERVDLADVDWARLDAFSDRSVFQAREWLDFLVATQGGDPVVARIVDGSEPVGWFTGMVVKRFGARILGSPFKGWTSGPMGFNLVEGASRREATEALFRFAFKELGCVHVELLDRRLGFDDADAVGAHCSTAYTFEIDLTREEDEIFGAMSSSCRRAVRKSEKVGVQVEQASPDGFADEYYAQLEDVFAKQDLSPPYPVERVRELIRCVEPSGRLLLLRARSAEGESAATAIFPVFNDFAYFWGGASWRSHQIIRPNEAIFWHVMRDLKARGVPTMDLGGGGDYKRKYGVRAADRPFLRKSRVRGMETLRNTAAYVYWRAATRRRPPTGASANRQHEPA
jgi:CelD/BcsL family acetyltransferase involved in cellulose biosynthesis